MQVMTSATPTARWCSRGRTWLLAWLVCGDAASAASAQSDARAAEPAAQPRIDIDSVVVQVADDDSAEARDLIPAKPADPVAAGERLLKSNISEFGARSLSRRAYGLHNTQQVELLDRMSRSLLDLNQLSEAEAQQTEALRLVQRAYPPGSDEVLEAIYKYAEWLGDRLFFQLQRDQYARALRMIRQIHGENDVRQVTPLLGIGNTYREERNPASMGISALEEALNLLQEHPQPDPVAMAMTLRDIGDWAIAFGKTGYSGTEYQRAWQMLGSAPNGDELRRQWFTGAN